MTLCVIGMPCGHAYGHVVVHGGLSLDSSLDMSDFMYHQLEVSGNARLGRACLARLPDFGLRWFTLQSQL